MQYVMVLNDGETYTGLQGCKIVAVSDETFNQYDAFGDLDIVVKAIATDDIESLSVDGEPVDPARIGHVVTTF